MKKTVKKGKFTERHMIIAGIIVVVIVLGILFRVQIGSMMQSIFGGTEGTELTGTNIIFEVGKNYSLEYIDENVYKITDQNGKWVKFAELEQDGSQRIFEDNEGRRHKFFVSESAMYLGDGN